MPTLKQLVCEVQLGPGDEPLTEYGANYRDGSVETFIAVPNKAIPFTISLKNQGYIAPGLAAFVYIDGELQWNRNRSNFQQPGPGVPPSKYEHAFRARQREEIVDDKGGEGYFVGREWTFATLQKGLEDDARTIRSGRSELSSSRRGAMGTIEVVVLRCKSTDEDSALTPKSGPTRPADDEPKRGRNDRKNKAPPKPTVSPAASGMGGMFGAGLFDGAADDDRKMYIYSVADQLDGPPPDIQTDIPDDQVWDSILGCWRPKSARLVPLPPKGSHAGGSSPLDFFGNPKGSPLTTREKEAYVNDANYIGYDDRSELFVIPSPLENPFYAPFAQLEVNDDWLRRESSFEKHVDGPGNSPRLYFNEFGDAVPQSQAMPTQHAPVGGHKKHGRRATFADNPETPFAPRNYEYRGGERYYHLDHNRSQQKPEPQGYGHGHGQSYGYGQHYPVNQQHQGRTEHQARTGYGNEQGYDLPPPPQYGGHRDYGRAPGTTEGHDHHASFKPKQPYDARYNDTAKPQFPETPSPAQGRHRHARAPTAETRTKAYSDSINYVRNELHQLYNTPHDAQDVGSRIARCLRKLDELEADERRPKGSPYDATPHHYPADPNPKRPRDGGQQQGYTHWPSQGTPRAPSAVPAQGKKTQRQTVDDQYRGGAGTHSWGNAGKSQNAPDGWDKNQAGKSAAGGWANAAEPTTDAWAGATFGDDKGAGGNAWDAGSKKSQGAAGALDAAPVDNAWDTKSKKSQGDGGNGGWDTGNGAAANAWDTGSKKSQGGGDAGWAAGNDAPADNAWDKGSKKAASVQEQWGNDNKSAKAASNADWANTDNKSAKAASNNDWGNTNNKSAKAASNTGWGNADNESVKAPSNTAWDNPRAAKPNAPAPSISKPGPRTFITKAEAANLATPSEINWARKRTPSGPISKPYWAKPATAPTPTTQRQPPGPRDPYIYTAAPAPVRSSNIAPGVDHGVQAGRGAEYYHGTRSPDYLDSFEAPYAVFVFKYRAKEVIEQIVGKDIGKEFERTLARVEEARLRGLSREDLVREMLRKEKEGETKGETKGAAAGSVKAGSARSGSRKEGGGGGGASGWGGAAAAAAVAPGAGWNQVGSGQVGGGGW